MSEVKFDRPAAARRVELCSALLVFSIGLTFAFVMLPADMVLGRWSWVSRTPGDHAATNIGFMYFALDHWRWPPLQTTLLNPPTGINAVFTDPVPAIAMLGKLFFKLTGVMPHYIGPWISLCYGLQTLAGYAVFRQLRLDRSLAILGSILLVLLPSFIFRHAHVGLAAQFVILLAILAYLRATTVATHRELLWASLGMSAIILFNPYLFAMSTPIYAAGLAEAWRRGRASPRQVLENAAVLAGSSAAIAFGLGFVTTGSPPATSGFGFFSLNLLSPFTPQMSALPWSIHGYLDMTGGQYEGFNYLGAGVLLLLAAACIVHGRELPSLASRHLFLLAALAALTFFAASDKIWLGSLFLGDLRYSDLPILSIPAAVFRSSGRFFWPVAFVAVVTSVTIIARKGPVAVPMLLVAIFIQVVDIGPLLSSVRESAKGRPPAADLQRWESLLSEHSELHLFPKYYCTRPEDRELLLLLQVRAAHQGIPSNGAYINRGEPQCLASAERFLAGIGSDTVTANPLLVIFKKSFPRMLLEDVLSRGYVCRDVGTTLACSKQIGHAFALLGKPLDPPKPINLGVSQSLANSAGSHFLWTGWSAPERDWTWGEGSRTEFVAKLPRPLCNSLTFRASVAPLSFGDFSVSKAEVSLYGAAVGEIALNGVQLQTINHRIPLYGKCLTAVRLALNFPEARSPLSLGLNRDKRILNWRFNWFALDGD